MPTIVKYGKVLFSETEITFIKENFKTLKNHEIAKILGCKITVVRMKAYQLGLQKMKLEYWSNETAQFLKDNYNKIGDREMCKIFTLKYPKQKGWTSKHIQKKMAQLNLKRNKLDLYIIKERNRNNGSFGTRNLKNNTPPPKVYYYLNSRTKIEIKPGQSIMQLKEKYKHYDSSI